MAADPNAVAALQMGLFNSAATNATLTGVPCSSLDLTLAGLAMQQPLSLYSLPLQSLPLLSLQCQAQAVAPATALGVLQSCSPATTTASAPLTATQSPLPGATQAAMPAPKTSTEIPGITDARFIGQIVQYNEEKGFGFIHCPELLPIFNKDIFLHRHQVAGFIIGEKVSFGVFLSKSGQAQAKDLSVPVAAKPAPASAGDVPGVTDRRFMGTIVAYNQEKGFGFISNPELKVIFGKDVFLHKEQVGIFGVGSQVAFGVFLNKQGQAQAKDLSEAGVITQGHKRPAASLPALVDMPLALRPRTLTDLTQ